MRAGSCCLSSTRLSFLLVNLSCLLTKRDYRHVRFGFALQWYVISRPTPQCKQMILKLASVIYTKISFRLSWDYLGTGLHIMQLLCLRQVLHCPVAGKWLHLHLFPGLWLSSVFSSCSCQVAGTGLAIIYSIVLFFPICDQVPCEYHLNKQTKPLHFPSSFPVPLSGATLRDFLSTHRWLKVQIVELQFSSKGSMQSKLVIKKPKKPKPSCFLILIKDESGQYTGLWVRKQIVTFRLAISMSENICFS